MKDIHKKLTGISRKGANVAGYKQMLSEGVLRGEKCSIESWFVISVVKFVVDNV